MTSEYDMKDIGCDLL